jgi:hypothetical protein
MSSKAERASWPVRKGRLGEEEPNAYAHLTPEERVGMVWEITRAVWAFMGHGDVDPTLQRHIGRVVSRGR